MTQQTIKRMRAINREQRLAMGRNMNDRPTFYTTARDKDTARYQRRSKQWMKDWGLR